MSKKYLVCHAYSIYELEQGVEKAMSFGFLPQGGMCANIYAGDSTWKDAPSRTIYYQAMITDDKENPNE